MFNENCISIYAFLNPALYYKTLYLGVYFNTTLILPTDCQREPMCEVFKDKMKPGTKLFLQGDITSSSMTLRAGWSGNGIPFGDNMVLVNAEIMLTVSFDNTDFNVQGEMKFLKQQITFKGKNYCPTLWCENNACKTIIISGRILSRWTSEYNLIFRCAVGYLTSFHRNLLLNQNLVDATP